MTSVPLAAVIQLWMCAHHCVQGDLIDRISFDKPFDFISSDGTRRINLNWEAGGTSLVNRHFVRLTPDRQRREGNIWSTELLNEQEFSIIFTFRISGQASRLYGDALALWVTTEPKFAHGYNHGFKEKYTGFGVIVDTYRNAEDKAHKDVYLQVNDGSKTFDDPTKEVKGGCMAPKVRYYEKHASFSPSQNTSRIKVQYKENLVVISVDEGNDGIWKHCHEASVTLPDGWSKHATVGITATTGALANNHDVISLKVHNAFEDEGHTAYDVKSSEIKAHDPETVHPAEDIDARLQQLSRKYTLLLENFEHQFTALKESTDNTIKKFREQEKRDEEQIAELEKWLHDRATSRITHTVEAVRDHATEKLHETIKETTKKSGGWKLPFFLFLLSFTGVAAFTYKKYQQLRKSHLL